MLGEFHMPIQRYNEIKDRMLNAKIVLVSDKDKYHSIKIRQKSSGVTIEVNDEFAIIKCEFRHRYYGIIL